MGGRLWSSEAAEQGGLPLREWYLLCSSHVGTPGGAAVGEGERTRANAVEGGHLPVLQWARAHGCPPRMTLTAY